MSNLFKQFERLLPRQAAQVGDVVTVHADGVTVELPTGALVRVRGEAEVGDRVYIRGGAVDGPAPDLAVEVVEI